MADAAAGGASTSAKTPADFLKSIKGKPVIVKLNSGVDYRGGCPPHQRPPPGAAPGGGAARAAPAHACTPDCRRPPAQECWPAWTAT